MEDPGATHALAAHTKTKHFMRLGVQQDRRQIGNTAKVMYCTFESAKTSHIPITPDLGFPPYAGDDNLYPADLGRGRATDASATQIEEVRVAPILTDVHAKEEELVAQIERLLATRLGGQLKTGH